MRITLKDATECTKRLVGTVTHEGYPYVGVALIGDGCEAAMFLSPEQAIQFAADLTAKAAEVRRARAS